MGAVALGVMGCGGGVLSKEIRDSLGIYRISIGNFSYGTGNTTGLTDFSVDVVTKGKTTLEIVIPRTDGVITNFSDLADDFSNLEVTLYLSSTMEVIYPDENGQKRRPSGGLTILQGDVFEAGPVEIQVRGGNVDKTYSISIIRDRQIETAGGTTNAIPIYTEANIDYMRQNLNESYILKNDIVLATEFMPIRTFSNDFNGNNKTISNLTIVAAPNPDVGMFEVIGRGGAVRDLRVVMLHGARVAGSGDVGILAGENQGEIENVKVEGAVYLRGVGTQQSAGGLVGRSSGTITESYARANVRGERGGVGGLVGSATAPISNSHATGVVTGTDNVGGLVGTFNVVGNQEIQNSSATGMVTGDNIVGGLVGNVVGGTISDSFATGDVKGRENKVGGLVGQTTGSITQSFATGSVNSEGDHVGGLVGYIEGPVLFISASYATGEISGRNYVGGLVGVFNGLSGNIPVIGGNTTLVGVLNSYAVGNVRGEDNIGGLMGELRREVGNGALNIQNSYAIGRVEGSEASVGGLVGNNDNGSIQNSYFDGVTTGQERGVGVDNTNTSVTPYYTVNNAVRVLNNPGAAKITQDDNFTGWDFVGDSQRNIAPVWYWHGVGRWPTLQWQHTP